MSEDGSLRLHGRICLPGDQQLRQRILQEAYVIPYSVHLGMSKMYEDPRQYFWQDELRPDAVEFVARCQSYQQVKVEHQRLVGKFQLLSISEWKWEEMFMYFVTGMRLSRGRDDIWALVDQLTKQFTPVDQ